MARKISQTIIMVLIVLQSNSQEWITIPNDILLGSSSNRALDVLNDTLIIAGNIGFVDEVNSYGAAMYYEGDFFPLGPQEPIIYQVSDMIVHNFDVYVVGIFSFEPIEFEEYKGLACWNGSEWVGLLNYSENTSGFMAAIHAHMDQIFVAGPSNLMAGVSIDNVAAWNGTEWINPGGTSGGTFDKLITYNDTLLGGGPFISGNDQGEQASGILYWDEDTTWHEFHGGVNGNVFTMTVDEVENDLYVGGFFNSVGEGVQAHSVARWDGEEWSAIEEGVTFDDNILSMAMYRNQLYIGGIFDSITRGEETIEVRSVLYFDGAQWQTMDGGMEGGVRDMMVYEDELYMVGSIFSVGQDDIPVNNIVKWYVHPDSVVWGVDESSMLDTHTRYFTLYPNPNDGAFKVEFQNSQGSLDGSLLITDLNGRQILLDSLKEVLLDRKRTKIIDLQEFDLPDGTYLCNYLEGGVIRQTERFVLE